MPLPKQSPPLRPLAVAVTVERLRVFIPVVALATFLGAGALTGGLVWLGPQSPGAPVPLPTAPQVPLLESTPAAALHVLAAVLPGTLPRPGPNQLRAGRCDPERSQVEVSGGCWVETKRPPPCPRGKQWEHEGRCWLPVAEAKPVPTSGELPPLGVAGP